MGIEFNYTEPVTDSLIKIPDEERQLWGLGFAQANVLLEKMYSLVVFDLVDQTTVKEPTLDPARRTTAAEFFFRVPPKVHEMHEPFATQIVPTQNGGRFVESHGSLIKEIRVQGTTGFRPDPLSRRSTQNSTVQSSTSVAATPAMTATGFDDIVFLKNMFRFYSDLKHDLERSSSVAMLWRNVKDGEYWIVEPVDFKVSQSSQSPLTYEYDFQLKTLSKLSQAYTIVPDPLTPLTSRSNTQSELNKLMAGITDVLAQLTEGFTTIRRVGVDVVNTILKPLYGVLNGLASLKHAGQRLVNFVTADLFNVAINLLDAYERLLTHNEGLDPQNIEANTLKNAARLAARALQFVEAFEDDDTARAQARKRRLADAYNQTGTTTRPNQQPSRGSSSLFIGDQRLASALAQDYVRDGEDIRGASQRLLGSRGRWHTLVVVNDLRAPYISATGGPGVLKPGDPIAYPSRRATSRAASATIRPSGESGGTESVGPSGPAVEAYGRDIRLLSTEVSPYLELTDLSVSSRGDIDTIAGIPNVDQAVRLKFATEQGTLTIHPTYGAQYPIGTKSAPTAFSNFRINVEATLRSDPRIKSIDRLSFQADGDVLSIQTHLRLTNQSDSFVTTLEL